MTSQLLSIRFGEIGRGNGSAHILVLSEEKKNIIIAI